MTAISGLSVAEERLVEAAASGAPVDLRTGDADADDPRRAGGWGPERAIRADVLAGLLCGPSGFGLEGLRAVRLQGARITGELDLEAVTIACPLAFGGCAFERPVIFTEAQAVAIRMPGCHVPGIAASQLALRGDLVLSEGFTASAEVCLAGATIGGQLILDGATLSDPGGRALSASWVSVGQSVLCRAGFTARGQVHLEGARIGGLLSMNGGCIINPGHTAVDAQRMTVHGAMFCREGFRVEGELRLFGTRIGGQLNFDGAVLDGGNRRALFASQIKVENTLFCRRGFTARGEIILDGADIGGRLDLSGAHLLNPDGRTLTADRLTTGQSMYCRELTSDGEIVLIDAKIGGRIDFTGARLANGTGYVLDAGGLDVAHDANFNGMFTAHGEIHLLDAEIGGRLDFEGARLINPDGRALNLEGVRAPVLFLLPWQSPDGLVDLANARVGTFHDDRNSWPGCGCAGSPTTRSGTSQCRFATGLSGSAAMRAATYRRSTSNSPTPTGVPGRLEDARQVAIARQRQRSRQLNVPARAWNWLLYVTVGYGYRTWLAGIWLAGLVAAGTAVFAASYPGHMHKSGPVVPAFNPFVYTLDTVLPVVDLGEQKAWIAQGAALTIQWLLICAGWILTTAVVAGVTNALNRRG